MSGRTGSVTGGQAFTPTQFDAAIMSGAEPIARISDKKYYTLTGLSERNGNMLTIFLRKFFSLDTRIAQAVISAMQERLRNPDLTSAEVRTLQEKVSAFITNKLRLNDDVQRDFTQQVNTHADSAYAPKLRAERQAAAVRAEQQAAAANAYEASWPELRHEAVSNTAVLIRSESGASAPFTHLATMQSSITEQRSALQALETNLASIKTNLSEEQEEYQRLSTAKNNLLNEIGQVNVGITSSYTTVGRSVEVMIEQLTRGLPVTSAEEGLEVFSRELAQKQGKYLKNFHNEDLAKEVVAISQKLGRLILFRDELLIPYLNAKTRCNNLKKALDDAVLQGNLDLASELIEQMKSELQQAQRAAGQLREGLSQLQKDDPNLRMLFPEEQLEVIERNNKRGAKEPLTPENVLGTPENVLGELTSFLTSIDTGKATIAEKQSEIAGLETQINNCNLGIIYYAGEQAENTTAVDAKRSEVRVLARRIFDFDDLIRSQQENAITLTRAPSENDTGNRRFQAIIRAHVELSRLSNANPNPEEIFNRLQARLLVLDTPDVKANIMVNINASLGAVA